MSTCKDCGEPLFQNAAGEYETDRRKAAGAAPEGKERRAAVKKKEPEKRETPPHREHLLHRQIFGGSPKKA